MKSNCCLLGAICALLFLVLGRGDSTGSGAETDGRSSIDHSSERDLLIVKSDVRKEDLPSLREKAYGGEDQAKIDLGTYFLSEEYSRKLLCGGKILASTSSI